LLESVLTELDDEPWISMLEELVIEDGTVDPEDDEAFEAFYDAVDQVENRLIRRVGKAMINWANEHPDRLVIILKQMFSEDEREANEAIVQTVAPDVAYV
jgi:hypothetical protein